MMSVPSIYYRGIIFHLFWAYTIPLGFNVVFCFLCISWGSLALDGNAQVILCSEIFLRLFYVCAMGADDEDKKMN